jgi:HJR/Mrr/RecB family endonuclease
VANPAKKRGTEHETRCVRWLRAHGWSYARRITQKGSRDEGDIRLADGVPVVIEAKNEKAITIGTYIAELDAECVNAECDQGVVIIKRRGTTDVGKYYALTTVDRWNALALAAIEVPVQRRRKRFVRVG